MSRNILIVFFVLCRLQAQPVPQAPPGAATKPPPGAAGQPPPGSASSPSQGGPVALDLAGALQLARGYSQQFLAAGLATQLAREDRLQAKAALFPTLNVLNQYIYTQGNGTPSGVFVANDGVHIYNEQAVVHAELFSFSKRADYQRTIAAEAAARARQDVAARGVVATVVQSYYGLVTAQRHLANAKVALDEARRFLDITQKQERGGEVAHADVVKAQLQAQQRERDLSEAQLALDKARAGLGVLLFADLAQEFSIADDLQNNLTLQPLNELQTTAVANSPDLRAAQATLKQSQFGIASARGAYYPSLVLDYFYGIDANVFNTRGPNDRQNLGSVVQGTVTVPVWNWGATQSKVRQAELTRRQAEVDLQFAQRQLQAALNTYYLEAQTAKSQLESLHSSADLSAESLRLTLLRYQAGEATALEVADAQTTLVQARNAYADGLARYRVALAALQTLTGTL